MPRCTHQKLRLDEKNGCPFVVVCDACKSTWSIRSRKPFVLRFVRALPAEKREWIMNQYARQSGV